MSQELLLCKDGQLQDAQAWMARAQELDAYHVNTNNTLHAELRDRNEQLNQLWMGCQRQVYASRDGYMLNRNIPLLISLFHGKNMFFVRHIQRYVFSRLWHFSFLQWSKLVCKSVTNML